MEREYYSHFFYLLSAKGGVSIEFSSYRFHTKGIGISTSSGKKRIQNNDTL